MAENTHPLDYLEQQIRKGGSILHEGKLYRTVEQLRRAFDTPDSIEEEIAALERRRAELEARRQPVVQPDSEDDSKSSKSQPDDGLKSLTVLQLQDLAGKEEVDLTGINLKADIIAAIQAKRAAK